jgi:hypothetical protein
MNLNFKRAIVCAALGTGLLLSSAAFGGQAGGAQTTPEDAKAAKAAKRKAKADAKAAADAAAAKSTPAPAAAATPAQAPVAKAAGKSPATANASPAEIADAKAKGLVWVNTSSKIYHKDGEFFGKTKQGKFMSEADAQKAGYRAAKASAADKKADATKK